MEGEDIRWHPLLEGYVKLNTGSVVSSSTGSATIRGIVCNHLSNWIKSFSYHIGSVSFMQAELWGFLISLHMVWNKEFKKVILEVNSKPTVELISRL